MKKVLLALALALSSQIAMAEAEVKEVCKDKVDKAGAPIKDKDGKVKQDCKKIKVHKKFEGTEIPADKKK
jgi:ABC-type transporter MlaC component